MLLVFVTSPISHAHLPHRVPTTRLVISADATHTAGIKSQCPPSCPLSKYRHMAPELLVEGRVSKAADVYAFGITLWEIFTATHVHKGMSAHHSSLVLLRMTLAP